MTIYTLHLLTVLINQDHINRWCYNNYVQWEPSINHFWPRALSKDQILELYLSLYLFIFSLCAYLFYCKKVAAARREETVIQPRTCLYRGALYYVFKALDPHPCPGLTVTMFASINTFLKGENLEISTLILEWCTTLSSDPGYR